MKNRRFIQNIRKRTGHTGRKENKSWKRSTVGREGVGGGLRNTTRKGGGLVENGPERLLSGAKEGKINAIAI